MHFLTKYLRFTHLKRWLLAHDESRTCPRGRSTENTTHPRRQVIGTHLKGTDGAKNFTLRNTHHHETLEGEMKTKGMDIILVCCEGLCIGECGYKKLVAI
jgi:hypothetical protein